jgi:hypothetical protein
VLVIKGHTPHVTWCKWKTSNGDTVEESSFQILLLHVSPQSSIARNIRSSFVPPLIDFSSQRFSFLGSGSDASQTPVLGGDSPPTGGGQCPRFVKMQETWVGKQPPYLLQTCRY